MAEAEVDGAVGRGAAGEDSAPLDAADAYARYADLVYRYLLSLTRSDDVAQELTQETFYQAVRSVDRFDGSCKVTTWLCAIAKRVLLGYRRKHPGQAAFDEAWADEAVMLPEASPEEAFIRRETYLRTLQLLHDFDGETRELMYLRLFGDLSFKEIGTVLGRSENWARVTFYRGKEKLKKEMGRHEGYEG